MQLRPPPFVSPALTWPTLVLALAIALTACSHQPNQGDPGTPAPEPTVTAPTAGTDPATTHVVEEVNESLASTAAPSAPPPGAKTESAFDSNQWNSAVGLGGGSGGRFGGLAEPRMTSEADPDTEAYASILESGFFLAADARLSTFAADVDTASYANVRRMISEGRLPPADAVRVEELINAMDYRDPEPSGNEAFAVSNEVGPCPWTEGHQLLRIGLKTRSIDTAKVPPCNLVFLLDVSGSMRSSDKLPLVKRAMALLVDQLRPQDRVAIVTYAAGVKVPLESSTGDDQDKIHAVLTDLQSGGGTNGVGGIQKAYEIAVQNKLPTGINRVILCTDGDFNVGIRNPDELEAFIAERRDSGVFLTVLGVGGGNLKDDRLERLANKGNGVYAYLDSLAEGRRVLVEQFGASMMTVAKDVKLQVEFDPRAVAGYRLIGYENRVMAAAEFRDDKKDAGEIGAGHTITALYEIVPAGMTVPGAPASTVDATAGNASESPIATLRLRYKPPMGDTAREKAFALGAGRADVTSRDHRLATAAAAFGMLLRGSPHLGGFGWSDLGALLDDANLDAPGLRQTVDQARRLAN